MTAEDDDGVTLDPEVKKQLETLAESELTAARYLDACDTIMDLQKLLATSLAKATRRHGPREIEQDGVEYLVFVVPSPMTLIKAVDTFCIIFRPEDSRLHVHSYANCDSMKQYEGTRSAMRLAATGEPNLNRLFT